MNLRRFMRWVLAGMLAASAATADPGTNLLQVLVAFQRPDPMIPWQNRAPDERAGYALPIGGGRMLTTEDLVRNHTLVELREPERARKIPATVEVSDYQCNLAVLRVDETNDLPDAAALEYATNLTAGMELRVAQFDETGAIQDGGGRLLKLAVGPLPGAPGNVLAFTMMMDMNLNGPGAPVYASGKLAGVVMQYDRGARTALALPYPVIRRFLDAIARPPYAGVASAGFAWSALTDPVKRAYLGVPAQKGGIMVLSILPGSGASETLKPGDVITDWDGVAIDSMGFYVDPEFGRLLIPNLISGRRTPGETVPVSIVRDRRAQPVGVRLARRLDSESLIPENVAGERAEYVADAGYVIRELTGDYLQAAGAKWELQGNPRLVHMYFARSQAETQVGDRVVLLSRVLPDPINIGYHQLRDEIVTRINGQPVRNMKDVFRALDQEGALRRISLKSSEVDIVVDPDSIDEANARIARQYHIPKLRHRSE